MLDTTTPNVFSALHDMRAGWSNGCNNRPARTAQRLQLAITSSFEVVADPQAPLLHYHEPSAGRRLALLYLGASNEY